MRHFTHPTECFFSRPDTMVEVVDDSDNAKIPAGTALNNPRQWIISVVPTNISVWLTVKINIRHGTQTWGFEP